MQHDGHEADEAEAGDAYVLVGDLKCGGTRGTAPADAATRKSTAPTTDRFQRTIGRIGMGIDRYFRWGWIADARASLRGRKLFTLFAIVNLLNYLDRGVIPGGSQEYNLFIRQTLLTDRPDVFLGILQSGFILGFSVACVVFARLARYRSPFSLMGVGLVVWCAAAVLAGSAKPFGSYTVLLAARLLSGVGEASFVTVVPPLITETAPPGERGIWLSLFYTAQPVGAGIGYVYGSAMATSNLGWPWAFYIEAFLMAPLALACALVPHDNAKAVENASDFGTPPNSLTAAADNGTEPLVGSSREYGSGGASHGAGQGQGQGREGEEDARDLPRSSVTMSSSSSSFTTSPQRGNLRSRRRYAERGKPHGVDADGRRAGPPREGGGHGLLSSSSSSSLPSSLPSPSPQQKQKQKQKQKQPQPSSLGDLWGCRDEESQAGEDPPAAAATSTAAAAAAEASNGGGKYAPEFGNREYLMMSPRRAVCVSSASAEEGWGGGPAAVTPLGSLNSDEAPFPAASPRLHEGRSRAGAADGDSVLVKDVLKVADRCVFCLVVLGVAASAAVTSGMSTFGTGFVISLEFLSSETAAAATFGGVICAAGLAGTPAGGALIDAADPEGRLSDEKKLALVLTQATALMCGATALLVAATLQSSLIPFLLLFFFGGGLLFATASHSNLSVMLASPKHLRPLALAVNSIMLHALGDVPSPTVIGWMKDTFAPHCAAGSVGGVGEVPTVAGSFPGTMRGLLGASVAPGGGGGGGGRNEVWAGAPPGAGAGIGVLAREGSSLWGREGGVLSGISDACRRERSGLHTTLLIIASWLLWTCLFFGLARVVQGTALEHDMAPALWSDIKALVSKGLSRPSWAKRPCAQRRGGGVVTLPARRSRSSVPKPWERLLWWRRDERRERRKGRRPSSLLSLDDDSDGGGGGSGDGDVGRMGTSLRQALLSSPPNTPRMPPN